MSFDFPRHPGPPPAAHTTLQRMAATVAVASGLAATGRPVDLAGLEASMGTLCAQVLDLVPSEGAALRPALQDLADRLAALTQAIKPPLS